MTFPLLVLVTIGTALWFATMAVLRSVGKPVNKTRSAVAFVLVMAVMVVATGFLDADRETSGSASVETISSKDLTLVACADSCSTTPRKRIDGFGDSNTIKTANGINLRAGSEGRSTPPWRTQAGSRHRTRLRALATRGLT